MTYNPNFIEVKESEYDGNKHEECPDCGNMIYFTPCPYCGWEEEE